MIEFGRSKAHGARGDAPLSRHFWLLIAFLTVLAVLGGSSRGSFWGVVVIRSLAIVVACVGASTMTRDHIRAHWFLFAMLAAAGLVTALELVPLPHALWSSLPGRGIIVDIDTTAALGQIGRPLTMSPSGTRNALYSMTIPLAVLIMAVQFNPRELRALITFFVVFGLTSALIASLQILGAINAPLSWYQLANDGSGSGWFTNRNHQALILCFLLPMLGVYAGIRSSDSSTARPRTILCMLAGMFLLPLILLTGSRGGLVFAILCVPVAFVLFRMERGSEPRRGRRQHTGTRHRRWFIAGGVMLAIIMIAAIWITVASGRAVTVSRFAAMDISDTLRQQTWSVVRQAISIYFPIGSGVGSYERVFGTLEPAAYLRPSHSNHAHNDWLEVVMTAGLLGAIWLAAGVTGFLFSVRSIVGALRSRQPVAWSLLGAVIVLLGALSSIVDYPLRVPMMEALYVIACLWSTLHLQAPRRVSHVRAEPVE